MPETTEIQAQEPARVEGSPLAGNLLERANGLLTRPEAKTWTEGNWFMRPEKTPDYYGKSFEKRDLSETFIATRDTDTNTSFMVHNGADHANARYTMIRWEELPDQQGDLVKGGGYSKYIYGANGEVVKVETGKWHNRPGVAGSSHSDALWFSGEASTDSITDADLKRFVQPLREIEENPLTDAELQDVAARFNRSTQNVDGAFAERAAQYVSINDRLGQAADKYAQAQRSRNQALIEPVKRELLATLDEYSLATGRNPEEERKKWESIQTGSFQEGAASSSQDETGTALTRGIIPKEIVDDPVYPKIREEVRARMVHEAKKSNQPLPIPVDAIDREVVKEYAAFAAKRAELQKLSHTSGAEATTHRQAA